MVDYWREEKKRGQSDLDFLIKAIEVYSKRQVFFEIHQVKRPLSK